MAEKLLIMKKIIKYMLLILAGILLIQCNKDDPEPEVIIPDDNFLIKLIELGVDTNGDGKISRAEAEVVTKLDLNIGGYYVDQKIFDLTGIEAFVNLDTLLSINIGLRVLDVSNNIALEYLICSKNQLSTLDVSNNTDLWILGCSFNQLSTLDISNNTDINYLYLSDMPSLYKVCVWELPFPTPYVNLDTTGSPNVYFTLDCN